MTTTVRKGRAKLSTDMEAEEVGVGKSLFLSLRPRRKRFWLPRILNRRTH